jgi:hypothetical protein
LDHLELLKATIGKEEVVQHGVIDLTLVQRFAYATGNSNPIFWTNNTEPADVPVPPTLIFEVNFSSNKPVNREDGSYPDIELLPKKLPVLRASNDYEILKPVKIGDRISVVRQLSSVTRKQGKRGKLIFLDFELKYFANDSKNHVGTNHESLILLEPEGDTSH